MLNTKDGILRTAEKILWKSKNIAWGKKCIQVCNNMRVSNDDTHFWVKYTFKGGLLFMPLAEL